MDTCCLNPQLDLNLQDWQCPAAICVLQWLVANRTVKLLAIISQAAADREHSKFRSISAWANGLRLLLVNCSLVMQSPNINFQDGPPSGQQSRRPTSCCMQVSRPGDHSIPWETHLMLMQVGAQGSSQLLGVDVKAVGQAFLILEQTIEQLLQLLWGDALRHIQLWACKQTMWWGCAT